VDRESPPRLVGTTRPPQLHEDAAHRLAGPVRLAGELAQVNVDGLVTADNVYAFDCDCGGDGEVNRVNLVRFRLDSVSDVHSVNLLSCVERVPPFRGGHVVVRYFGPVVVDQITDVIFGLRDGIPDSAHPCEVGVYPLHEQVHAGGVGAVVDPFTPGDEKAALELGHVRGGHLAEPDRPGLDSRSAGLDFQQPLVPD